MAQTATTDHSATGPSGDFVYEMHVRAAVPQVMEALTDGATICRWWTVATRAEQQAEEVRLFLANGSPFVSFTVEHAPGTTAVTWLVTACGVLADWIGTQPSFSVSPRADGTCDVSLRHVGLRPALECFEDCREGWSFWMPSLAEFLQTGQGRSNEQRHAS